MIPAIELDGVSLKRLMSRTHARIPIIALCLLGLIVQTLAGGTNGVILCLGCERGGWSIVSNESTAPSDRCCTSESGQDRDLPVPEGHDQMPDRDDDCKCFAVPLSEACRFSDIAPLSDRLTGDGSGATGAEVAWIAAAPVYADALHSYVVPRHPPWVLTPSPRFAILRI
jgi:hypothetical protein